MKWFICAAAFLTAFGMGVGAVVGFGWGTPGFSGHDCGRAWQDHESSKKAASFYTGKIDVAFVGKDIVDGSAVLKFRITNGRSEPLGYMGYSPDMLLPKIYANGKDVSLGWCGTGVEEHILPAGESITVEHSVEMFRSRSKTIAKFQIEYRFKDISGTWKPVRSDEFGL